MTGCKHQFEDAEGRRVHSHCQSCGEMDPMRAPMRLRAVLERDLGDGLGTRAHIVLEIDRAELLELLANAPKVTP